MLRRPAFFSSRRLFCAGSSALLLAASACGPDEGETVGTPPARGGRAGASGTTQNTGGQGQAAKGGQSGQASAGAGGTAGASGATTGSGGAQINGGAGGGGTTSAGGAESKGGATSTAGTGGSSGAGGGVPDKPPLGLPKDKGVIGYWCGPPAAFQTEAVYDDIAAAGFTLTSNACDGSTYNATYNKQQLAFAAARGMTSIVADQRVSNAVSQARDGKTAEMNAGLDGAVADYKGEKALAGYHVFDEPGTSLFPALGQVVSGLAARDPERISYLNLLPNYATAGQLGAASYDAYVAEYLSKVAPQIVSWDYYPFLLSGDLPGFFENLAIVRAHSLAAKRPFWQFVQAISFVNHRATTAAEKAWVVNQSLAYGAMGLWYFTYWTPPQTAEAFGNGIIDPSGNKTAQYAEITAINKSFAAMSKHLVQATSTGVHHNGPLESGTGPRVPGSPVYLPSFAKLTVGTFTKDADVFAVIANRDYAAAVESDVIVPVAPGAVAILDVATGAFGAFAATAVPEGARGHLKLGPGEAALLRLAGPVPAGPAGAEAMVGLVRNDAGYLYQVDHNYGNDGVGALRPAGWDDCPSGYTLAGKDFQTNGFWLCARNDLAATKFYVGMVLADAGTIFEVSGGVAKNVGPGGWDTCPAGTSIGKRFDSNGFWLCH